MDRTELFADLVATQVDLFAAIDARLRTEVGVLLIELLPLRVVGRTAHARVQDIADGVRISAGGASKSVDRMERDGLVVRRVHPDDRRSAIVELTDAGRQALTAGESVIADEMARRLPSSFDDDDFTRFRAVLRALGDRP